MVDSLGTRPWAQGAGVIFGQRAAARGVIVLNDPHVLADATTKMYFEYFPKEVRPRSLISRTPEDLKKFVADEGGRACLKPLQGSGGTNVFECPVASPRSDGGHHPETGDVLAEPGVVIELFED